MLFRSKEEMISAITTNVTDFAREPHHFTHFKNQVLPDLMDKARNGGSVRLWSAGCSNGSEPFTLACAVLDAFPDVGNYDFRILATDIDKYSINTAKSGEYKREMVEKLPKETVGRWFSRSGDLFKIDDRVRDLVHFKILNLVDQWPLQKKYDVIFCRNVLIYFTQEDQGKIIERFSQYMNPYSYLYIGHSERIIGKTATMFKSTGVTAYRYEPVGNKH